MGVGKDDVLRTAALAGLWLDEDEVERLTTELDDVLRHMEALPEPDATAAPEQDAGATAAPPPLRLRADRPDPDPLARPPSELAPAWEAGFFAVPRLAALDAEATGPDAEAMGRDVEAGERGAEATGRDAVGGPDGAP